MEQQGFHAIIAGRVQGVWFRNSTKRQALKLGLCGWVKNMADGRVELKAFGTPENLKQLETWLHKGPPLAKVTSVHIEACPFEALKNFVVSR